MRTRAAGTAWVFGFVWLWKHLGYGGHKGFKRAMLVNPALVERVDALVVIGTMMSVKGGTDGASDGTNEGNEWSWMGFGKVVAG
eukprot:gene3069-6019_t